MKVAIQSILVESSGKQILIDTCFGNDRELPYPNVPVLQTDFLERLDERGFGPADVDYVLCDDHGWRWDPLITVDGQSDRAESRQRYSLLSRGSQSVRARSPIRLKLNTVRSMNIPGTSAMNGYS